MAQIALAWILANRRRDERHHRREESRAARRQPEGVDVTLSADDLQALDEVSTLTVEYPAWMDALGSDRRPGERRF